MPVRLFLSRARAAPVFLSTRHRPDKQRVKPQYICRLKTWWVSAGDRQRLTKFAMMSTIIIEAGRIKKIGRRLPKTMEILIL